MTELEQLFNKLTPKDNLTNTQYVALIYQLQADRDAWMQNAKNWEKENKKLNESISRLLIRIGGRIDP